MYCNSSNNNIVSLITHLISLFLSLSYHFFGLCSCRFEGVIYINLRVQKEDLDSVKLGEEIGVVEEGNSYISMVPGNIEIGDNKELTAAEEAQPPTASSSNNDDDGVQQPISGGGVVA